MAHSSEPPESRPRHWLGRIGNPLDWSEVNKCILCATIALLFCAPVALMLFYWMQNPEAAPYVNQEWCRRTLGAFTGFNFLALFVMGRAFQLRRTTTDSPGLVQIALFGWFLGIASVGYVAGYASSPIGLVGFLGGTVFCGVLFRTRQVLWPSLSYLAISLASYVGIHGGLIPYAPLFDELPLHGGKIDPWYLIGQGYITFVMSCIVAAISLYTLHLWRLREEQLREAHILLGAQKDRLVRAESLAAVGSLVSGAAHELRNPLSSSGALLQSLREDLARFPGLSEGDRREAAETIDRAKKGHDRAALIAARLFSLTDDLITGGSTARLGESLEDLSRRYQGLEVEIHPSIRDEIIPQSIFKTTLPNLLENAFAAGGARAPRLEARRDGIWLYFTVRDWGRGIPAEIQKDVFKPFFTSQRGGEGHGVGLGLYIVHELASRMGGDVDLESCPGEGTRVSVRVPGSSQA